MIIAAVQYSILSTQLLLPHKQINKKKYKKKKKSRENDITEQPVPALLRLVWSWKQTLSSFHYVWNKACVCEWLSPQVTIVRLSWIKVKLLHTGPYKLYLTCHSVVSDLLPLAFTSNCYHIYKLLSKIIYRLWKYFYTCVY